MTSIKWPVASAYSNFTVESREAPKHLFFWALMFNRLDLAKFFWRKAQDHIGKFQEIPYGAICMRNTFFTDTSMPSVLLSCIT